MKYFIWEFFRLVNLKYWFKLTAEFQLLIEQISKSLYLEAQKWCLGIEIFKMVRDDSVVPPYVYSFPYASWQALTAETIFL